MTTDDIKTILGGLISGGFETVLNRRKNYGACRSTRAGAMEALGLRRPKAAPITAVFRGHFTDNQRYSVSAQLVSLHFSSSSRSHQTFNLPSSTSTITTRYIISDGHFRYKSSPYTPLFIHPRQLFASSRIWSSIGPR
jgi:hypothetical protein